MPEIVKTLVGDLETQFKLNRIPIFTAISMSLRNNVEDRFLVTDNREEDARRNVVKLARIVKIEQMMGKPDFGVDSRQFQNSGGILFFDGVLSGSKVVPGPNVTSVGGLKDSDGILFAFTGDIADKENKIKRVASQNAEKVCWHVRTPIMLAGQTSVLDFLAFRCTNIPFLHSVAIKWSDRRWDNKSSPITSDMFRPKGEQSHMVILPAMWMDETMSYMNPVIWGSYGSIVQSNLTELLLRNSIEYTKDCESFTWAYKTYNYLISGSLNNCNQFDANFSNVGRLERRVVTTANRSLRIPFDRSIDTSNNSYESTSTDSENADDITDEIFNKPDKLGNKTFTNSFDKSLAVDGISFREKDGASEASVYTTTDAAPGMVSTRALEVNDNFAVRRILIPDGRFVVKLWVKSKTGKTRFEVVRNNRLIPKLSVIGVDNHVSNITHYRENYETLTATTVNTVDKWEKITLSFSCKDHLFVKNEDYPAHEVFFVFAADGGISVFDEMEMFIDRVGDNISVINTVTKTRFPDLLLDHEKVVALDHAFKEDADFHGEKASSFFRFDGKNTCAVVEHRNRHNLHQKSAIDCWFKVNSEDEAKNNVLGERGIFSIFRKTSNYLPGYSCDVNNFRNLVFSYNSGAQNSISSKSFKNALLHPTVGTDYYDAVTDWADPNMYAYYHLALKMTGKQPREYGTGSALISDTVKNQISQGKYLIVRTNDPYLTQSGMNAMNDQVYIDSSNTSVDVAKYFEWHARTAYGQKLSANEVKKYDTPQEVSSGFIFAPIPFARSLVDTPENLGTFSPSPAEWALTHTSPFPVSPCEWSPSAWPGGHWSPLIPGVSETLITRYPLFLNGAITFDRWIHLNINVGNAVTLTINTLPVGEGASGSFSNENVDNLLIATTNDQDTNTCSPISVYSFKVYQETLNQEKIRNIHESEAINFNDFQYEIFGKNLDIDRDHQLDYYQESLTDYGLWVERSGYPTTVDYLTGKTVVSVADRLKISPIKDRNLNLIADAFDSGYENELSKGATTGFTDGLIFWDFITSDNNTTHSFTHKVYDPACKGYKNQTLAYGPWVNDLVTSEYNSARAATDTIPVVATDTASPKTGTFGDTSNENLTYGVKGRFGFDDILGYRDSLELLNREGMIFNYLQIEFRYAADRADLEAVLAKYTQSYDQLLANDLPGSRL